MHKLGLISLLMLDMTCLAASRESEEFCAYCCPYKKTHVFHSDCHAQYVADRFAGRLDNLELFKKRTGFCFFCYQEKLSTAKATLCELCKK